MSSTYVKSSSAVGIAPSLAAGVGPWPLAAGAPFGTTGGGRREVGGSSRTALQRIREMGERASVDPRAFAGDRRALRSSSTAAWSPALTATTSACSRSSSASELSACSISIVHFAPEPPYPSMPVPSARASAPRRALPSLPTRFSRERRLAEATSESSAMNSRLKTGWTST